MSSQAGEKWKGYAVRDIKNWDKFEVIEFHPKQQEDYDIDIKIEFCGVCGSDVHTITGGWGEPLLPLIPGHEIVGHVVRVGPKVTSFKVGDRAGVGAQVCSCFKCAPCKSDSEQYCLNGVSTYNAKYPNGDVAQGGYSTAIRAHERFVFPLPKELPLEEIAPMLCAGLTVYSPLVRNGTGPGKRVGVVGIGGLGHYALQFARALGAEQVVAFSHSSNKKDDALELGATDFVITGGDDFAEPWKGKLDLIICTADVSHGIPLTDLITTLGVHGHFIMVAIPDESLPSLHSAQLLSNGALIGGSHIGSKKEAIAMLELAAKKKVKSYIELLPMKDAGNAVRRVKDNSVRYRHVLKYVPLSSSSPPTDAWCA
ncbi:NADP-dependent alcohol dehydrogenase 6 [Hypsizygus marmoreus]|uniref:alcohol dehydrogenase (NADP(+)) n=1 Tax=Hypsizygus marmoreus TaxID=39966 RepID=A0A369JAU0_HYPMA|nr:NADP-dependent alcohol dehydrogenase 6 [Hypsizygus marmoreus]